MKEITKWLVDMENLANSFYTDAKAFFQSDKNLYEFLNYMAIDEALHLQFMHKAGVYLEKNNHEISSITLDNNSKDTLKASFVKNRDLLKEGNLTKNKLIDFIAEIEFTEWNHIFIYVVNTLEEKNLDFMSAASQIQQHLKQIERFLESLSEGQKHLDRIRHLPAVWKERILIVEDTLPVAEFLKDFLGSEGNVETAVNGKQGFEKAQ